MYTKRLHTSGLFRKFWRNKSSTQELPQIETSETTIWKELLSFPMYAKFWSGLLFAIFIAYLAYTMWVMYLIFHPPGCTNTGVINSCVQSYLSQNLELELELMVSRRSTSLDQMTSVLKLSSFSLTETLEKEVNITLPLSTRKNGTMFLHAFLYPMGMGHTSQLLLSHTSVMITTYTLPRASYVSLLGDTSTNKDENEPITRMPPDKPYTHWRSKVTVSLMTDNVALDRRAIPSEIFRYIRITHDGKYYYPILYLDEIGFRIKDLQPVNISTSTMPLLITYAPITIGKLRMWNSFEESFKMLYGLGFTEKDTDEIKGIFADTSFYVLVLTFTVAAFHLLFDFLAFKSDIQYWKQRESMVGLSARGVMWRCIQTIIIFLYLMDEGTSLLVTIPAGISIIIELWKVTKAYKLKVTRVGYCWLKLEFGESSDKEKETEEFDSQAMKYLSYILYPLLFGGAVYSLLFVPHRGWYAWCLQSLANGVYAFGFLFMLPQLFLNYKLKSVAHLPWRAFMYKAFNTFIDDIFAFIISMPTAHRLACFRDDVVFVIYLYQRWLYPVDMKRVNEFGMSFDEEQKQDKPQEDQTERKKQK